MNYEPNRCKWCGTDLNINQCSCETNLPLEISKKLTKTKMSAEKLLEKFEAAGWHSKEFPAMGVVAVNPHYADFGLSICEHWANAPRLKFPDQFPLWVYPSPEALKIIADNESR
jgi:hypothetical protein